MAYNYNSRQYVPLNFATHNQAVNKITWDPISSTTVGELRITATVSNGIYSLYSHFYINITEDPFESLWGLGTVRVTYHLIGDSPSTIHLQNVTA